MSSDLSSLSEDHIRQLGRIVETLEQSAFDFLQLEVGDLKVTVGKGNLPAPQEPSPAPAPVPVVSSAPVTPEAAASAPAPAGDPPAPEQPQSDTVDIVSPIMGMFYGQPEPGADRFVTVGAKVEEDSTVGLIEVMKTFNAVKAGVRGTIVELCVPEVQLVEYGQVLFRVAPE